MGLLTVSTDGPLSGEQMGVFHLLGEISHLVPIIEGGGRTKCFEECLTQEECLKRWQFSFVH